MPASPTSAASTTTASACSRTVRSRSSRTSRSRSCTARSRRSGRRSGCARDCRSALPARGVRAADRRALERRPRSRTDPRDRRRRGARVRRGPTLACSRVGRLGLGPAAVRSLELWQETPDLAHEQNLPTPREGLLSGETGLLIVAWRLQPTTNLADRLLARVHENKENETNEVMWGAPGTMLAARAMHGWTGEQRWLDPWTESADELRRRRDDDGLWTQTLHGHSERGLGPVHGAAGNLVALGADEGGKTGEALARAAVVEDGLANWPPAEGLGLVRNDQIR